VQERFRQALMKGSLLLVKGTLQKRDGVTHIVAGMLRSQLGALISFR
jgi:error-prone DNA polymerase